MTKSRFSFWPLVLVLIVCGCAIEVKQPVESTSVPSLETAPVPSSASRFPVTQVPKTWADLNLTGTLVYLTSSMQNNVLIASIQSLDLGAGTITTLFSAPPGAWIYYATISPDEKQLVMSFEPAAQPDSSSSRALYSMPLDATAPPRPLVPAPTADDHYTQAEWSPEGKFIYYVHYNHKDAGGQFYEVYEIFRMTYPDGEPQKILGQAFWPRVSLDSAKLVYVSLDPASGLNELFVANADGGNPQKVNFSGSYIPDIIDAPIFSPDEGSILFSAPGPTQSSQPNWLDKVMGIQVAKAHSIPSDWWSVPVAGGVPTRLTNLQTINLFASLSPDQKHIVSVGGEGLFLMDLDGSNLTQLISDSGVHGTVSWLP